MGTAGMPRRICDYADAFASWNQISTAGSITSAIAFLIFLYIMVNAITSGIIADMPNF